MLNFFERFGTYYNGHLMTRGVRATSWRMNGVLQLQ